MPLLPILFDLDDAYNDPWYWGPRSRHQQFGLEAPESPADLQHQQSNFSQTNPNEETGKGKNGSKEKSQGCKEAGRFKVKEVPIKKFSDSKIQQKKSHRDTIPIALKKKCIFL